DQSQKAYIGDPVPFSVSNDDNFPNSNAGYYLLNTKFRFDAIVYGFEAYLNSSGMIAVSFEKVDECLNDTEYSKCIQTNSSELPKCNDAKICFKQFSTRLIFLNCCFNNYTYAAPFFVPKGSMVYINQDDNNGMTGKVAIDRSGKAQYSDLIETYSNGFSNLSRINANSNWKLFFRVLVEPVSSTKPTTLQTSAQSLSSLSNPCQNEKNCHHLESQYGFHPTCSCQQQEICFKNTTITSPCSQQACLKESICKSLIVPYYQKSFTCECRNGSNECFESSSACNNLCKNGATCYIDIDLNVPFCWCRPDIGTTGKYCEFLEGCYEYYQTGYKCKNNGTCLQSADDYFNQRYDCKCQSGFGGKNCENKTADVCLSNPCLNKATCEEKLIQNGLTMGYKCNCLYGFGGENCQESFISIEYLIESFFSQILKILIDFFNYLF
ncbi:crumbs-like protein, partial [Brachionus plicatilis]